MIKISDGNSKLRKTGGKVQAHLAEHGSLNGFVPRPKAYRVVSFNIPAGGYEMVVLQTQVFAYIKLTH